MSTITRRSFAVVAVAALAVSGLGISATAKVPESSAAKGSHVRPSPKPMAAGIIVSTTTSKPSSALVGAADAQLPGKNEIASVANRGTKKSILVTAERIPAAAAEAIAASLEKRSDVVSATPNYVRHAFGAAPVVPNDPGFDRQKQLWDPRTKTDSRVTQIMGATNSFPTGGYSSKAPYLWRSTEGAGKVVAVVDTGYTDHPDLADQILPGWDFVSFDGYDWGRDGNGWDGDAHDMGDWESSAESCDGSGDEYSSSWHGTHVAGIVGAESGNSIGGSGVAPDVKILPVRVLGLCGGIDSDIAAGIRWAAGLPVSGDADNPAPTPNMNPADVINLSLGGPGACVPEVNSAITAARNAGSIVVAAAGNDGINLGSDPVTPATCPGVIAVGSTSEYGDIAGFRFAGKKYVYSNFGAPIDISAPGGDQFWDNRGIYSTFNAGVTSPGAPAYREEFGTSMAAPVVSAAAALVDSLGNFGVGQVQTALQAAVSPFPTGVSSQFKRCLVSLCGDGIINLAKVPAPISGPSVTGVLTVGESVAAEPGTWNAKPASFTYAWLRNGVAIPGATASTYTLTAADIDKKIRVRLSPGTGVFTPVEAISAETAPVPKGPTVVLSGLPTSTTHGVAHTATVTVASGATPVDGPIEIRRGSSVIGTGTAVGGTATIAIAGTALSANSTPVRAAFLGDGGANIAASSPSAPLTVGKATSTVRANRLPASISRSKSATMTITIRVPGVPGPAGSAYVYDNGKKIATYTMTATRLGVRAVTLPRITAKGTHKIQVKYSGSLSIKPSSSAYYYLKVY